MSHRFTPKIISANALLEGDVIYFTVDDKWSRNHAKAEFIENCSCIEHVVIERVARLRSLAETMAAEVVHHELAVRGEHRSRAQVPARMVINEEPMNQQHQVVALSQCRVVETDASSDNVRHRKLRRS